MTGPHVWRRRNTLGQRAAMAFVLFWLAAMVFAAIVGGASVVVCAVGARL